MSESQIAAMIKKNQEEGACGWLDSIAKRCQGEEGANYHLEGPGGLITIGTHSRNVLQSGVDSLTLETAGTEYATKLQNYCFQYDAWLSRWRAAAADVAAVGLDGSTTSYYFWQENIRLPDDVTRAYKWFATVERMIKTTDVDSERLNKFAGDALEHIDAMKACKDSWPPARRNSIGRRVLILDELAAEWELRAAQACVDLAVQLGASIRNLGHNEGDIIGDAGVSKAYGAILDGATERLDEAVAKLKSASDCVATWDETIRELRARQLKKRTCWMCGKTGPNSSHAFAYCGGCRDLLGVPREYLPRYCSEACQRAHWLASHKDNCLFSFIE